jgi:hypothetical protein
MNRDARISEEVEKTLRAFDDLPTLEANPFLFTRLQARLAQEGTGKGWVLAVGFRLKPVVLAIVILLNIVTVVYVLDNPDSASSRDQLISTLRQEYHAEPTSF